MVRLNFVFVSMLCRLLAFRNSISLIYFANSFLAVENATLHSSVLALKLAPNSVADTPMPVYSSHAILPSNEKNGRN
jgi:hypothetical protein